MIRVADVVPMFVALVATRLAGPPVSTVAVPVVAVAITTTMPMMICFACFLVAGGVGQIVVVLLQDAKDQMSIIHSLSLWKTCIMAKLFNLPFIDKY